MTLANSFVAIATGECVAAGFACLWSTLPGAGKVLYLSSSPGSVTWSRSSRPAHPLRWIELHLCHGFLVGRKSSLIRSLGSSGQRDSSGSVGRPIGSTISYPATEP